MWYTPSLPSQVAVVGLFLKLHSYWCLKRKMLVQNTFSIIYSFSNLVFLQSLLLCSLFCTYCWLINLREANKQKFQCHKQQFYKSLAYTTQELFQIFGKFQQPHSGVSVTNIDVLISLILRWLLIYSFQLSKPNNNHNPNSKTPKTVVCLGVSNHWETTTPKQPSSKVSINKI